MKKGLSFEENIKSIKELVGFTLYGYIYEPLDDLTLQSLDCTLTQFFDSLNNEFIDNITVIKEDFLTWILYKKGYIDIYYEFVVKPIYKSNNLSSRFYKMSIAERYGLI